MVRLQIDTGVERSNTEFTRGATIVFAAAAATFLASLGHTAFLVVWESVR